MESASEKIHQILNAWKSWGTLCVSYTLNQEAQVYILKISSIDTKVFNKIASNVDVVWVGPDFMEHGYMIEKKHPLFHGDMYYWHKNEVYNLEEVIEDAADPCENI